MRLLRAMPSRAAALLSMIVARPSVPLLDAWGFARSLRVRQPVDGDNAPLPWLPYCVVALLEERLKRDLTVLEFGAGYSTLFFMTRVGRVTSIEHDSSWVQSLRKRCLANVTLIEAPAADARGYCAHVAASTERYDLILVDGIHRNECFPLALERLTDRGVLVLDDSARTDHQALPELASRRGFKALRLHGHKPASVGLHWTTVFYRANNCLEL